MSRTLDILETIPHGTPAGYRQGCRTAACPAPLACRDVYRRYSGDLSFKRALDAGEPLADILAREAEEARPKKNRTPRKEPTMTDTTPNGKLDAEQATRKPKRGPQPKDRKKRKPVAVTPLKRPAAGPTPAEVRAWARANGIDVNTRGTIRNDVMAAYSEAHTESPPSDHKGRIDVSLGGALLRREAEASVALDKGDGQTFSVDDPPTIEPLPAAEFAEALEQTRDRVNDSEKAELFNALADHYRDERDVARQALTFMLAKWGAEHERVTDLAGQLAETMGHLERARDIIRARDDDLATAQRAADRIRAENDDLRKEVHRLQEPWWRRKARS